jgi:hypothetical protein
MTTFVQDIRHSLRGLVKQPVFTVVAVFSLALGIGVNTAIFSALDALLLRPLDVRALDRTVIVYDSSPGRTDAGTTFPAFQMLRDRRETFAHVMATPARAAAPSSTAIGGSRYTPNSSQQTSSPSSMSSSTADRRGRNWPWSIRQGRDLSHAFTAAVWGRPAIVRKTIVLNGQPFLALG